MGMVPEFPGTVNRSPPGGRCQVLGFWCQPQPHPDLQEDAFTWLPPGHRVPPHQLAPPPTHGPPTHAPPVYPPRWVFISTLPERANKSPKHTNMHLHTALFGRGGVPSPPDALLPIKCSRRRPLHGDSSWDATEAPVRTERRAGRRQILTVGPHKMAADGTISRERGLFSVGDTEPPPPP